MSSRPQGCCDGMKVFVWEKEEVPWAEFCLPKFLISHADLNPTTSAWRRRYDGDRSNEVERMGSRSHRAGSFIRVGPQSSLHALGPTQRGARI